MALPALIPVFPPKSRLKVDFKPEDFYGQINDLGLRLWWEQAALCPCAENPDTVEGRFGCSICRGVGREYLAGMEIRGIITDLTFREVPFELIGRFGFGLVSISLPPEQTPGFMDRFTLLDSAMTIQDLVTRKDTLDDLRWPVIERSVTLSISGVATDVTLSVLHLRRVNSDGSAGPVLTLGTDFVVTVDGKIDWTLGDGAHTAPAVGQRYSIRYYGHPRYLVLDRPRAIRDTRVKFKHPSRVPQIMPVQVLCKLDWMRFGQ